MATKVPAAPSMEGEEVGVAEVSPPLPAVVYRGEWAEPRRKATPPSHHHTVTSTITTITIPTARNVSSCDVIHADQFCLFVFLYNKIIFTTS